jgi:agmatine deiminase
VLKENLELLRSFKSIDNESFRIIELPMPEPVYYKYPNETEEIRLPASYANFYITNKYVIVPVFNSERDKLALEILQREFKDRKVIGIDATNIVVGLGAFHCLSQQIPV